MSNRPGKEILKCDKTIFTKHRNCLQLEQQFLRGNLRLSAYRNVSFARFICVFYE